MNSIATNKKWESTSYDRINFQNNGITIAMF